MTAANAAIATAAPRKRRLNPPIAARTGKSDGKRAVARMPPTAPPIFSERAPRITAESTATGVIALEAPSICPETSGK